jgi:serine protease Do
MHSWFAIPVLAVCWLICVPAAPAQFNSFVEGSSGSRIGVGLRDIDADRAAVLKLGSVTGAEVITVESGSPAEQAGIRPGDVLLSYNGESIVGAMQLGRLVSETPVGRKIKIEYLRNGKVVTVTAITAARQHGMMLPDIDLGGNAPGDMLLADSFPTPRFLWTNRQLGIEYEAFDSHDSQLAEFFGVKHGVLVRAVIKESAAGKAGLRAGDVIIEIGGHVVADPREITHYVRQEQRLSKPFSLEVMRERKASSLKVTLAAESQE